MRPRPHFQSAVTLAFLLAATPSCGGSVTSSDPNNKEIAWAYGPTSGAATAEHLKGTGKLGDSAIAGGWQCRLRDGKNLTVTPYQLASSHALFGKVRMVIGLFDKNGKQIGIVRSEAITAENATFAFELSEATAQALYDVVIWFGEV